VNNPFERLPIDPRLKKVLPYIISIVLLLAVLIGAIVASGNSTPPVASSQPDSLGLMAPSSSFDITLEVVLKILFVFGLIYMFFALLKWWQKKQPGQAQTRLRIVETVRPSPRQTFYLLKVDSQEFLVGATDQSMALISEIEPEAILDTEPQDQVISSQLPPSSFNTMLQQTFKVFQRSTPNENVTGTQPQVLK
jgi:flagellar biogenesis protein FliO